MGDLRSQLLQAGLASASQVQKADADSRKRRHGRTKKSKKGTKPQVDPAQLARQQEEQRTKEAERRRQREQHEAQQRQLQEKHAAERRRAVALEQARQIIERDGLPLKDEDEVGYSFVGAGSTVKKIWVSKDQQRQLGCGDLGVVRPHANLSQYLLMPRAAALRLQQACPEKVVLLHDPDEEPDEFDGLMW